MKPTLQHGHESQYHEQDEQYKVVFRLLFHLVLLFLLVHFDGINGVEAKHFVEVDTTLLPKVKVELTNVETNQKYYLEETEEHYFKEPHPNVLNLEFDDISEETREWMGHEFLGFSTEQAQKTYKFIKSNLGKDFWIHCRAGASRSQGVVRFILDTYGDLYDWQTLKSNPCVTPNYFVTGKLKRLAYEDIDEVE